MRQQLLESEPTLRRVTPGVEFFELPLDAERVYLTLKRAAAGTPSPAAAAKK